MVKNTFIGEVSADYAKFMVLVVEGYENCVNVLFCSVLISTIAGWLCAIVLALFFITIFLLLKINKGMVKSTIDYQEAKKERVGIVKNLINNLKFIKFKALENYYFLQVRLGRIEELKIAKSCDRFNSLKTLMFSLNKSFTYIVFLLLLSTTNDSDTLSVGSIAATIYLLDIYSILLVSWQKFLKFSHRFEKKEKLIDQYLFADSIEDEFVTKTPANIRTNVSNSQFTCEDSKNRDFRSNQSKNQTVSKKEAQSIDNNTQEDLSMSSSKHNRTAGNLEIKADF